jgi:hypothetical protein
MRTLILEDEAKGSTANSEMKTMKQPSIHEIK